MLVSGLRKGNERKVGKKETMKGESKDSYRDIFFPLSSASEGCIFLRRNLIRKKGIYTVGKMGS